MNYRLLFALSALPALAACAPDTVMRRDPKTNVTFECKATESFDMMQSANQVRECRKKYEGMGWKEVED